MYIFKKNILRLYIKYIYILYNLYEYKYIHVNTCKYIKHIQYITVCVCLYIYIINIHSTRQLNSKNSQRFIIIVFSLYYNVMYMAVPVIVINILHCCLS